MSDEPRSNNGDWSQVPSEEQEMHPRPAGRRRRSMEDSGGISVSDLVARHGSRNDLPPQPQRVVPAQPDPARHAMPPSRRQPVTPSAQSTPPSPYVNPPVSRVQRQSTEGPRVDSQPPQRLPRPTRRRQEASATPQQPAASRQQMEPPGDYSRQPRPSGDSRQSNFANRANALRTRAAGHVPGHRVPQREAKPDRPSVDPMSMTTELEAVSEVVKQKREVDATLARFSAVHDEMAAEERQRRSRRMRFMPWIKHDEEMERALSAHSSRKPMESDPGFSNKSKGKLWIKKIQLSGRGAFIAKIVAIAIAVIVLVLTGAQWVTRASINDQIKTVAALDENSPAIQDAAQQTSDDNFLLIGASGSLTDPIMVAHVPADHSKIIIVSFPSSLAVTRPSCMQWNSQNSQYTTTPVPAADGVALGSVYQTGGPRCITDAVQGLTGLRINHFVGISSAGFISMVNELQGVTICANGPIQDSQLGTIVDHSGTSTLSGNQALNLMQAQHVVGNSSGSNSQVQQIARQQKFLAAAFRQIISQGLLLNSSKLNDFLGLFANSAFGDNVDVDQLLGLATSLQGLSPAQVTFVTVPTTGSPDANGNAVLMTDQNRQLFTAIINNSVLPGESVAETGANSPLTTLTDPQSIKIQVSNGGNPTARIAANTADQLHQQGFQIMKVDNDAATVSQTTIRYSADRSNAAQTLASTLPSGATLQLDPTENGAIMLILGPDFNGKVVAPHTGTTDPQIGPPAGTSAGLSTMSGSDTSCL